MLQKIYQKVIKPKKSVEPQQQIQQNDLKLKTTPDEILTQKLSLPLQLPPPAPLQLPPQTEITDDEISFKSPKIVDYPSRTRILRHLSSGGGTPQSNHDEQQHQQQYCCICNSINKTLTPPICDSRRQSWGGSYLYLNRTLQQQQPRSLKRLPQPPSTPIIANHRSANIETPTSLYENLIKFKSTKLGSSAPNLSSNLKELSISRKNSTTTKIRSFNLALLQTSSAPSPSTTLSKQNSPLESPRFKQKHQQQHLNLQQYDTRRWSFASICSSSGYNSLNSVPQQQQAPVAPTIRKYGVCGGDYDSSQSSQYSSHERLLNHQQPQQQQQCQHNCTCFISIDTSNRDCLSNNEHRSRFCSMNDNSSILDDSSDGGGGHHHSPSQQHQQQQCHYKRVRARSLSCSPSKMHSETDIITVQNEKFKEKFPKACRQMEENLENFIQIQQKLNLLNKKRIDFSSLTSVDTPIDSPTTAVTINEDYSQIQEDAAAHFVYNQIIELAKSCLDKSKECQLTCAYFDEITNSLEKLLNEACDKCNNELQSLNQLHKLVNKFLLIIARVARLLECLEFDPLEFCQLLNAAEVQARHLVWKTDIPKYIISKLGLNRDPLEEFSLNNNNTSLDTSTTTTPLIQTPTMSSLSSISSTSEQRKKPTEDDFEELKLISNGAYGAVYLVRHRLNAERYAMKKIKKQNLILRNQVQQVFTERDIMTFTDNPFVVALICTFETKKHLCMVMEYVEGGDVAILIKNMGPLPLDMARVYFAETTLAVEYLHSYGIIHRDLKPDNLLITSMGHVKLTDFGLSKVGLMNLTTNFYEGNYTRKDQYCKEFNDKQVCGTPQYLAPEVILRQGYGKAVDWWSMGIILYEFLTSWTPFNGSTPEDLFANVINGEIQWPDSEDEITIPEDAKNIISSLLKHDPLERLGAGGPLEIKNNLFFLTIDWDNLLRIKADFIPQLDGPDDTSYFDTRSERYNHDLDEPVAQQQQQQQQNEFKKPSNRILDDNDNEEEDDEDESELFQSFSSCSSKYKLNSRPSPTLSQNIQSPTLSPAPLTTLIVPAEEPKPEVNQSITKATLGSEWDAQLESLALSLNLASINLQTEAASDESSFKKPSNDIQTLNNQQQQQIKNNKRFSRFSKSNDDKLFNNQKQKQVTMTTLNPPPSQSNSRSSLKPHLSSSSSFNCKRTTTAAAAATEQQHSNYRFPNSVSYSKLSHLTVPANELNKQSTIRTSFSTTKLSSFSNAAATPAPPPDSSPIQQLIRETKRKIPIMIKRGPRGYGFTLRAIKVFYNDSDFYTIQHLVIQVDEKGPAYEAGLRAQDLITHVNEKCVCGLLHHEVMKNLLSGGNNLQLRTIQLNQTSIKSGGRKRSPSKSKLSRPLNSSSSSYSLKQQQQPSVLQQPPQLQQQQQQPEKKKKPTLFRKLSERRAQRCYEQQLQQQQQQHLQSPFLNSDKRNISNSDLRLYTPQQTDSPKKFFNNRSAPICRSPFIDSSSSSSPASSVPNSPAIGGGFLSRPRSLIVTNNYLTTNSSPEPPILSALLGGFNNSSSSSSLSSSPLNLSCSTNYNQNIIQPVFRHQPIPPQTHLNPSITPQTILFAQSSTFQRSLSSGAATVVNNSNNHFFGCGGQFYQSPNSSNCSSCASSSSSLNSNYHHHQQLSIANIQNSNNSNNNNNNNNLHLSPSPLAISDGLAISYGNPNTTQTFTPTTQLQNSFSTAVLNNNNNNNNRMFISNSNYHHHLHHHQPNQY